MAMQLGTGVPGLPTTNGGTGTGAKSLFDKDGPPGPPGTTLFPKTGGASGYDESISKQFDIWEFAGKAMTTSKSAAWAAPRAG
jgi:hypothetical protein